MFRREHVANAPSTVARLVVDRCVRLNVVYHDRKWQTSIFYEVAVYFRVHNFNACPIECGYAWLRLNTGDYVFRYQLFDFDTFVSGTLGRQKENLFSEQFGLLRYRKPRELVCCNTIVSSNLQLHIELGRSYRFVALFKKEKKIVYDVSGLVFKNDFFYKHSVGPNARVQSTSLLFESKTWPGYWNPGTYAGSVTNYPPTVVTPGAGCDVSGSAESSPNGSLVPREIADTDRLSYCTSRSMRVREMYAAATDSSRERSTFFVFHYNSFSVPNNQIFQITVNESLRVRVAATHSAARVGFKYSDGGIDSETSTRKNLG